MWQRNFHVRRGLDQTATKLQRCEYVVCKNNSHECQKLGPLHRDRCTGEHTDHSPKAIHLNVCMLSSVWARSCLWIGVSTPHQIFPHPLFLFTLYFIIIIITFLLLYFQRLHTSDNDQITYLGFTFVLKKE